MRKCFESVAVNFYISTSKRTIIWYVWYLIQKVIIFRKSNVTEFMMMYESILLIYI